MIGEEFDSVLARAQSGDEAAFARLWLDVHPTLWRYLTAVAGDVDIDVVAEALDVVIRGLVPFRGDEMTWRAWVFATARRALPIEPKPRSLRPRRPASAPEG